MSTVNVPLEKDIEKKACEWAKSQGWLTYKFTSPNRRSVPDRIFVKQGHVIFIEFKRPGGRLTSGQEREIEKLVDHGAEVHVAYSVEEVQHCLNNGANP